MSIELYPLSPHYDISRIITGCWQLAGGHGDVDRSTIIDDLQEYYRAGCTTFDCADIYTGVEELLGMLRVRILQDQGREALDRLKVHTKFVPDLDALPRINRTYVREAVERALRRLGVERLDMVQLHWWDYTIPGLVQTAIWLKDLQQEGKLELIGGTNFSTQSMQEIVGAGVDLAAMQVQYSLLDNRPANGMSDAAQNLGISLLCYGSIAGGFLSERWLGQSEPVGVLQNRSLTKYKLVIDEFGGWLLFQRLLSVLSVVAHRHQVDIATVASRYVLDLPAVGAVIIGARNREHLPALFGIEALQFTQTDLKQIHDVLAERRGPFGDVYGLERQRQGPHGAIMKYNLNSTA